MGILDDFVNSIKKQREQFKAEQQKAGEKAANEKSAAAAEQRPPAKEARSPVQEFKHRIEEQRKEFKEAQHKDSSATGPTKTIQQEPPVLAVNTVERFGHKFTREQGSPGHVWFDDGSRAVYIDNVDAYLNSGGKVEVKGITAAMEPDLYNIYTPKGGPLGQARYYLPENAVVSIVRDPFVRYR